MPKTLASLNKANRRLATLLMVAVEREPTFLHKTVTMTTVLTSSSRQGESDLESAKERHEILVDYKTAILLAIDEYIQKRIAKRNVSKACIATIQYDISRARALRSLIIRGHREVCT